MIKEMNWAEDKRVTVFFKEEDADTVVVCGVKRVFLNLDFLRIETEDETYMYKTDIINGYFVERE